jgi:hypothetical protein
MALWTGIKSFVIGSNPGFREDDGEPSVHKSCEFLNHLSN